MRVRISRAWTNPVPPVELVSRVSAPVAIIHGVADSFIPVTAAHDLYAHAPEPRRLRLVDGMGHAFSERSLVPIGDAVDWALAPTGSGADT